MCAELRELGRQDRRPNQAQVAGKHLGSYDMRKLSVITTAVALAALVFSTAAFAGGPKAQRGVLDGMLEAYASTSGQGGNSGRIWSGEGQIESIGRALVLVKASWNWSFYNGDHPSALVNNRTVDFDGCRDDGMSVVRVFWTEGRLI